MRNNLLKGKTSAKELESSNAMGLENESVIFDEKNESIQDGEKFVNELNCTPSGKRSRTVLPLLEKFTIIKEAERSSITKTKLAEKYGLASSTLLTILKNKKAIEESFENFGEHVMERKSLKKSPFEVIESALCSWIKKARCNNVPINTVTIRQRAMELAVEMNVKNFGATNGWLQRFKNRNYVLLRMGTSAKQREIPGVIDTGNDEVSFEYDNALLQPGADDCETFDENLCKEAYASDGLPSTQEIFGDSAKSENTTKRMRTSLSLADKLAMCKEAETMSCTKTQLSKKYGIAISTLMTILKNKDTIERGFDQNSELAMQRKRMRRSPYEELEVPLNTWVKYVLEIKASLTDHMIRRKALDYALEMELKNFKATNGWLHGFKRRYNIVLKGRKTGYRKDMSPAADNDGESNLSWDWIHDNDESLHPDPRHEKEIFTKLEENRKTPVFESSGANQVIKAEPLDATEKEIFTKIEENRKTPVFESSGANQVIKAEPLDATEKEIFTKIEENRKTPVFESSGANQVIKAEPLDATDFLKSFYY